MQPNLEQLSNFLAKVRKEALENNITLPLDLDVDSKMHRFSMNGKKSDDAGWYILHNSPDGYYGGYGCWRTAQSYSVTSDREPSKTVLSKADWLAAQAQREQFWREKMATDARLAAETAARAARMMRDAKPASNAHPYLVRKKVSASGALEYQGMLIIPVHIKGALSSLQMINWMGGKKFLKDGNQEGGYFVIGGRLQTQRRQIALCEGFATGATIRRACNVTTVVAFNSGNLLAVATYLRRRFPDHEIIVCGDDDWDNELAPEGKNVGAICAANTAENVSNSRYVLPVFDARDKRGTDFNDMANLYGDAEVNAIIFPADKGDILAPLYLPEPIKEVTEPPPLPDAIGFPLPAAPAKSDDDEDDQAPYASS